jgi:ATP-dependent helicase/nuclease subunit B
VIRLVESASAAERLAAVHAFLQAVPPATERLLVAASREAADDLARQVTLNAGATFGIHRYSLTQLAARVAVAELARLGLAPSTPLGAEAIAARVTFDAREGDALPYFAPVARFPGFARALAATLGELRSTGIGPAVFGQIAARLETPDAAGEVGALLERFEAELAGGAVCDLPGLLAIAARALAARRFASLRQMPIALLDVPIDSTVSRTFVAALTAESPSVLVTVPAGDEATLAAIAAIARSLGQPAPDPRPARQMATAVQAVGLQTERSDSDLARLRAYLFAEESPPETAIGGEVVLFSAPGEAREAAEIARRALEEARAGTPFDRMAVLLRAPEVYSTVLEVALARAGIPAYFAGGARRPDPAGRALLALLDCAVEKLSARRFAEYLSLGQVPSLDADGAPPIGRRIWTGPEAEALGPAAEPIQTDQDGPHQDAGLDDSYDGSIEMPGQPEGGQPGWSAGRDPGQARADHAGPRAEAPGGRRSNDPGVGAVVEGSLRAPWRWEELLVESAVIGGKDRWSRRLAGLEAEYRMRLEELRKEESDSPRLAALERDLANLGHLRRFALPVIDRLAALPAQAPWGEWLPALEQLAPMVLRRPERVLAVLAELRPLGPIGPVSLPEVREVLADQLASLPDRPPADRYGRVFVGAMDQARGRAFDAVFIPGLAERTFPQKPREDPLLLDSLRERLAGVLRAQSDLSSRLRTQGDRVKQERLLLRLGVGAATRRLYLSYSRIDLAEARPRVASFYALEVTRALAGRIPDPETMASEAASASRARLAWPGPDDPRQAIDPVEHDLSTLGALLREPSHHGRGRARYLLGLNDCLARSLRSRWARWMTRRWTPADGIVRLTDSTREALQASQLTARAYSVSALQKFATCPYQFFLSAICRLEPRAEIAPLEQLDPLTRGSIFHRVQADLMRALQQAGRLPLVREGLAAAMGILDETLENVAGRYREELAPAIQRVWRAEIEAMRVDLRVWLERSVDIQASWEPVAFELAFGLPADPEFDSRSVPDVVSLAGRFKLRGIVDLVEKRHGSPELRVTDYKTGGNRTRANLVVGGGETLQPVLYGLAVEQVMAGPVTEGRLFFCTRAGQFAEIVIPLSETARQRGLEVLGVIDGAIARGFLPPAPRARACGFCDFRDVCGPNEEARTQSKDRSVCAELLALREWR